MIANAAIALRRAVRNTLIGDTALLARLDGPRVYDEAPRDSTPPYVTLGDVRSRDWSTSSDAGAEHFLTIEVWSRHHGAHEALEISELVATAMQTTDVALGGHRLVLLRSQGIDTRRENGGRFMRARHTFRALTEQE